jgi:dipeptidyl aminopeptidase/acylaminoacyl peptidase
LDPSTGKELRTLQGTNNADDLAFSPDSKLLAACEHVPSRSNELESKVRVWEISSGKEVHTLEGHPGWIRSLAFSADGKLLATAAHEQPVPERKAKDTLEAIRLLALTTGSLEAIRLWDSTTGKFRVFPSEIVEAIAFTADGKTMVAGGQEIVMFDVAGAKQKRTLPKTHGHVFALALSPDGKILASAGQDKTISLWNVATGAELASLIGHEEPIRSLAFSPQGTVLASGSHDTTILLWDVQAALKSAAPRP